MDNTLRTTLGQLIDDGSLEVAIGFPCGNHGQNAEDAPHIRPFNVTTDGRVSLKLVKTIPKLTAASRPRLRPGDVLFNNTNSLELVGKCALWQNAGNFVFSNHMTRIRIQSGAIDPAFLAFALLQHWRSGKSRTHARAHVAQASIIGQRFREMALPRFSHPEERAIGSLLTCAQHDVELADREIDLCEGLKRAVMRELFTRGLRGELRKESELGRIPDTWQLASIGDHFTVASGGTPSRSNPHFWRDGIIPWVKTTEINYDVITRTEEAITELGLRRSAAKMLAPGTILMAMYGQGVTRGKVAVLGIEAACNQACAAMQPSDDSVIPKFLLHYLEYRYEEIRRLAHGGQQQNLNLDIVRSVRLAFPTDTREQTEIVEILDAIDEKLTLHKRKRDLLDDLFETLLNALMSGQVSASDLDLTALDEAAARQKMAELPTQVVV